MKLILLLLVILSSTLSFAGDITALVRIEKTHGLLQVIRVQDGLQIPVLPDSESIKAQLQNLADHQDVLLRGHIRYVPDLEPQKLRPVFVIEDLREIALKDLQIPNDLSEQNDPPVKILSNEVLLRPALPLSSEAASAITMTTSFLLMEELTNESLAPKDQRDLNRALFLSAGTMATIYFIYQQIKGKLSP